MIAMPIGSQVTRVGHRYVTDDEDRPHIGGIGGIGSGDDALDGRHRGGAAHIAAQNGPPIALEVADGLRQLGGQRGGERVVHQ